MKALVLREYGRLSYEEAPDPVAGPRDVLVQVRACGICGSDVHGMDGSTGRRIPPLIMGHEAAGEIAAVGEGVTGWPAGERVTFDSTISCGECRSCLRGEINLCERRRVLGVACDEYRQEGAFAEFVAVPAHTLYRLPDGLDFATAAMVEPLSVAQHAASLAPPLEGARAVVMGAGVIGLLLIQVLRAAGCARITAVDINAHRRALAQQLGADEAVAAIGTAEADVAFDAVGLPATVAAAVHSVRKGGTVVLIGNLAPSVELPLQAVVARQLTVRGSCASAGEYPACLRMLAEGRVQVGPLISAIAPLAEGPAWFERLRRGEGELVKVILEP